MDQAVGFVEVQGLETENHCTDMSLCFSFASRVICVISQGQSAYLKDLANPNQQVSQRS